MVTFYSEAISISTVCGTLWWLIFNRGVNDMDKKMFAEWLRDIAQHIEENSPLIRNLSVVDDTSDDGFARKNISITFNAPGRSVVQSESDED